MQVGHRVRMIDVDRGSLSIVEPELDRSLGLALVNDRLAPHRRRVHCTSCGLCGCAHTRPLTRKGDVFGRRGWNIILASLVLQGHFEPIWILLTKLHGDASLLQLLEKLSVAWVLQGSERPIVLHLEAVPPQDDLHILGSRGSLRA